MRNDFLYSRERIRPINLRRVAELNAEFRCLNCRNHVGVDAWFAGVRYRNHCPYCLWSKHLDLIQAGDRLAACKAGMRPVALSIKQPAKKYALEEQGELLLVHQCTGCGKVSLNRIAADDDPEKILEIFSRSQPLQGSGQAERSLQNVRILTQDDGWLVKKRLFGQESTVQGCE